MDDRTKRNAINVSFGVQDVVVDYRESINYDLIPICVQPLVRMFMNDKHNANKLKYRRVLMLDISIGYRCRVFRYNGNGMAEWMRVLSGQVTVYSAPCTPFNCRIFEDYSMGRSHGDPLNQMNRLHYLCKNVLLHGDTLIIPPNYIVFDITNVSSVVIHGEFFSGIAHAYDALYRSSFLIKWRTPDFLVVYKGLVEHCIDVTRNGIQVVYYKGIKVSNLVHHLYCMLVSLPVSHSSFMHNYGPFSDTLPEGVFPTSVNMAQWVSCINLLFIVSKSRSVCHTPGRVDSNCWIPSLVWTEKLLRLDMHSWYNGLGDNGSFPEVYMTVFKGVFYSGHSDRLFGSIQRQRHDIDYDDPFKREDMMKTYLTMSTVNSQGTYGTVLSDHDGAGKLSLNCFIGVIGDNEITLPTLFKILYCNIASPIRKMQFFINDITDRSRNEAYKYCPELMMLSTDSDTTSWSDVHRVITVDEILLLMYTIAKPIDIRAFYRFARFSLIHNRSGLGPSTIEHTNIICPIRLASFICNDEWIIGFLHQACFDQFMTAFTRLTPLSNLQHASHPERPKGAIREFCLICLRPVLSILKSDDGTIMIIRYRVCTHSKKN